MVPEDIAKTAVITLFDLFKYLRIIFGLLNAVESSQCFIKQVFRGLDFVYDFIGVVFISSSNLDEQKLHLRQVF